MGVGALVAQVGAVLARGHALFGESPRSDAFGAWLLSRAANQVNSARRMMAGQRGESAAAYHVFGNGAGTGLDGLAGRDRRLRGQLRAAADIDRAGRVASAAVVDGASDDTAGLAPFANTPAGQKALLTALRRRIRQQQNVIHECRVRAATMDAILRSMAYGGPGGPATGGTAPPPPDGGPAIPTVTPGRSSPARSASGETAIPQPPAGTPGAAAIHAAIERALDIKGIESPHARASWTTGLMTIAARESDFNPDAVNTDDVNAARGTPSQGAFQMIAPTFAAHHEPGTSSNLRDPVAQAVAVINYVRARYGVAADGSDFAALVQQADPTQPPLGY